MQQNHFACLVAALLTLPGAALAGPCADGGWGHIEPAGSLHVAPDGDDSATGTAEAPLASIYEALARSRSNGLAIGLHPGEHDASLLIDGRDDGLRIAGCGGGESFLIPAHADEFVLDVEAAEGLMLAGLGVVGGKDAITVHGGAAVEAEELEVSGAVGEAVTVEGPDTELVWTGGSVRATEEDSGEATAFHVQDGRLEVIAAELSGNVGRGIWLEGGELFVDNTRILATLLTAAGYDGEAIVADAGATLVVNSAEFTGNEGSAVDATEALFTWMENISVTVPTTGMIDPLVLNEGATLINVILASGAP
jgi:hypothetical protein